MSKPARPRPPEKTAPVPATRTGTAGTQKVPEGEAKPARRARAAPEPLTLTEKIFVRARPEKVYFAAVSPATRSSWDKSVSRARFAKPSKSEAAATKPAPGALVELLFPLRLGGLFQMQFMELRQPQGFSLAAVRGSFGPVGGLGEIWQFQPFKGGTQVTLVRQVVPRFKAVKGYVERNQLKAMKVSLEGLKKHVEEGGK